MNEINTDDKYGKLFQRVLKQTSSVNNWYKLGTELGVSETVLDEIAWSHKDSDTARMHVIKEWFEINRNPTMAKISAAMLRLGEVIDLHPHQIPHASKPFIT